MKRKINLWLATHQTLSTVLFSFLMVGLYFFLDLAVGILWWGNLLIVLAMAFAWCFYVVTRKAALMNGALSYLSEDCDPRPMLELLGDILKYKSSPAVRELDLMNYANYLIMLDGYEEKGRDMLLRLDIDKYYANQPFARLSYYGIISAIEYERADANASLHLKMAEDILKAECERSKRMNITLSEIAKTIEITKAIYEEKDLRRAIELIGERESKTLFEKVGDAHLLGECYIGLGEAEKAREQLKFVLENGNKLSLVSSAKKMLEGLEGGEKTQEM